MIRHSVVFKLKDQISDSEVNDFFIELKKLTVIPGVQNFECLKQISKKNNFDFGLTMDFKNEAIYEQYNNHPIHVNFVKHIWLNDVADFMELDFLLDNPVVKK